MTGVPVGHTLEQPGGGQVVPGDLFVCMEGSEQDGDDAAEEVRACPRAKPLAWQRAVRMAGSRHCAALNVEGRCSTEKAMSHDVYPGHHLLLDAAQAVARGAVAVVADRPLEGLEGVPVVVMPDVPGALSRLAVAFYNAPSEKMTVVGVVGAAPSAGPLAADVPSTDG